MLLFGYKIYTSPGLIRVANNHHYTSAVFLQQLSMHLDRFVCHVKL